LTDFFTRLKFNSAELPIWFWISTAALLISIFSFFRFSSAQDEARAASAMASVLRNEYIIANSYALSKSISDLENLDLLRCATLSERGQAPRVFYDTSTGRDCGGLLSGWSFFRRSIELKAINGMTYQLSFSLPLRMQKILLELMFYVFVVVGMSLLVGRMRSQKLNSDLRLALLQLKHETAIDSVNQVHHDVAAPLGALRIILKTAKNLEPELHSVLSKAIQRTEMIFERLRLQRVSQVSVCSIERVLTELLDEKMLVWGSQCTLKFDKPNKSFFVLAQEDQLGSVLSNLLNNAFESHNSFPASIEVAITEQAKEIIVSIADLGIGMTDHFISLIGTKGLSSGKSHPEGTVHGLGVYNARQLIESWGGRLEYQSQLGLGTTTKICFLKAER
jgi:signal transduction histidine kinase